MGYRVLLIAVTGREPSAIHAAYGVALTNDYSDVPDAPVNGATLSNGAYLLYVNDDYAPDDAVFSRLSKCAALIACYANETVMNSYACGWLNGAEQWSVFHDAQQDVRHLETTGTLPPEFSAIQQRLVAEQAKTDEIDCVFDIPVEIFAALDGIRYNEDIPGAPEEPWEILARTGKRRRRGGQFVGELAGCGCIAVFLVAACAAALGFIFAGTWVLRKVGL